VPVHIDHVQTDLDVRPSQGGDGVPSGVLVSGMNGTDRGMVEQLRPIVLLILREELDRLRRQQG
jgi:hypothetical protein